MTWEMVFWVSDAFMATDNLVWPLTNEKASWSDVSIRLWPLGSVNFGRPPTLHGVQEVWWTGPQQVLLSSLAPFPQASDKHSSHEAASLPTHSRSDEMHLPLQLVAGTASPFSSKGLRGTSASSRSLREVVGWSVEMSKSGLFLKFSQIDALAPLHIKLKIK
nr:hypothetical protein Iba_chr13bCG3400 [Ipomoea batatas]